jgi:hypothetical protein
MIQKNPRQKKKKKKKRRIHRLVAYLEVEG